MIVKKLKLESVRANDFALGVHDFADLEIRIGNEASGFYYFYDLKQKSLIKHFRLRSGDQVDELCDVTLVKPGDTGRFEPRLKFWKRNTTKAHAKRVANEEITVDDGGCLFVKASVDLHQCPEEFWQLLRFIESFEGVDVPADEVRFASGDEGRLLAALGQHDKSEILSAVSTQLKWSDLRGRYPCVPPSPG